MQKTSFPIFLLILPIVAAVSACALTGHQVRNWIDDKTAVTITAQKRAMVFFRDDFQAGVNVHDFADLGAFEVNQTGKHRQYLCMVLWSTLARTPEQQALLESAFSSLVIWADDQPITFKRATQNHEMLNVSSAVFNRTTAKASENFYEISAAQLNTLANAKQLRLAPENQAQGQDPYRVWQNEHASLSAFAAEVSSISSLMNHDAH